MGDNDPIRATVGTHVTVGDEPVRGVVTAVNDESEWGAILTIEWDDGVTTTQHSTWVDIVDVTP